MAVCRDSRQARCAQRKCQYQSQSAECAETRILHDREAGFGRFAAEAVGAIAQAVLMQSAGQQDERSDGEQSGQRGRKSKSRREGKTGSTNEADHRASDGQSAGGRLG